MRWIWIDRIVELDRGRRCVALKNVSLAEDVLHDHFSARDGRGPWPVFPQTLIIEGMAQTAGILVGHARDFKEKVILAKIGLARFTALARPGFTLRYTAVLERIDESGAATGGEVELIDPGTGAVKPLAKIDLLYSHIDQNRAGLQFPEHNFVFTGQLMEMLRQSGLPAPG
ncbi:MAG: hypothetical protein IT443_00860 [Phycisphaeraceae bacterium]|nr:hypothetical protein [Phycisphaeraceae bacterium]